MFKSSVEKYLYTKVKDLYSVKQGEVSCVRVITKREDGQLNFLEVTKRLQSWVWGTKNSVGHLKLFGFKSTDLKRPSTRKMDG